MRDGFARITFALSIWREDVQWHLTLLGCGSTVMSITINPMIPRDQDGVTAFPPFHKDSAKEYILLNRLPAVLG